MSVIARGIRNTFRNNVRTVSIVLILALIIGLALAMLMARQAVEQKIQSVKQSFGNTVTIAPAGVMGFEGGGEALTTDQLDGVSKLDHVTSVTSTLNDRLTDTSLQSAIEAGNLGRRFNQERSGAKFFASDGHGTTESFTPPVLATGTNDSTSISAVGAVTLKSGEQIDAKSDDNVALIGTGIADKNNLQPGSTFTAYGQAIAVKGILETSDNRFASNIVVLPLATLQRLSNQAGAVTGASATVDSVDNTASVTAAIKTTLGDKADVTNQQEAATAAIAPLNSIKAVSMFALIAAVAAGAVIILLTMVMIVRERRREIGVLKAIGATNGRVVGQFMVEATTFTLLAATLGIFVAIGLANPLTDTLVNNAQNAGHEERSMGFSTLRAGGPNIRVASAGIGVGNLQDVNTVIGWDILGYGLLAAIGIALVGSGASAWFITKVRPAEAIRAE